jgi:hypothetical protein
MDDCSSKVQKSLSNTEIGMGFWVKTALGRWAYSLMSTSPLAKSIAERDIEIASNIDIYIVRGEAEPSDVNAVDFIIASARAKVARLEAHIEKLSVAG